MHTYPLLRRVSELYDEVELGNVLLLACQHLLAPQKRMFKHLLQLGLKPENCVIVGKNYSTSPEVLRKLKATGCIIAPFSLDFDPLVPFDTWFEEKLTAFIAREISRRPMSSYDKVIILDDGGFMHMVADKLCNDVSNIVGIEQTSSGHHRIKAAGVRFPSTSVARSHPKLMHESPYIGKNGYEKILRYLQKCGKKDPNVLVMGLGHIGRQIAGQMFCVGRFRGVAVDPKLPDLYSASPVGRIGAVELLRAENRIVSIEEAQGRLTEFDMIIGTAGSPVITENDLPLLHPRVSLISMSSSDREFPAVPFRQAGGTLHDDYHLEGRTLVNGGFPITFDGARHAMPPQQIELTMALLMIHLLDSVRSDMQQLSMVVSSVMSIWAPDEGSDEWYRNFHADTVLA